jgi:hypothetical protein
MADFEEPCFVGRHLLFVFFVGITQIILYAIGLPFLVFLFIHRHRHELNKPVVKFRYSLFFAGFRPEKYYWEVIVALRKESTVILAVFGPNMGTSMLAHVALLVFLVQILIQLVGHPYTPHQQKLQVLDVTSIIVCWFTMWSGFFFLGVKKEWDRNLLVLLTAKSKEDTKAKVGAIEVMEVRGVATVKRSVAAINKGAAPTKNSSRMGQSLH